VPAAWRLLAAQAFARTVKSGRYRIIGAHPVVVAQAQALGGEIDV
jgi:hypothetical protein